MKVMRKLLAVSAASLLATLGVGAASPTAQAQNCQPGDRTVQSGSLQWGLKESFRNYITGRIAQGYYEVSDGANDLGSAFEFPVTASTITSDSQADIDLDGKLYFYGHDGALDITLEDFGLVINGSQAEITVDYHSYKFAGYVKGVKGEPISGDDGVLAVIDLEQPADFSSNQVSLAGSTTMGAAGREIFGDFYEPNQEFDRTNGQLNIVDGCGPAAGGGAAGGASRGDRGATDSGATTGAAGLLGQINDTLVEVNGLFVNTDNVLSNGQDLHNKATGTTTSGGGGGTATRSGGGTSGGNSGGGTVTRSGGGNSGGATSTGGGTTGGGGGGGTVTRSGGGNSGGGGGGGTVTRTGGGNSGGGGGGGGTNTVAASTGGQSGGGSGASTSGGSTGGGAPSADICSAADAVGVQSAQAQWGVRQSFRNYIRGTIANGGWNLGGVTYNGNEFEFTGSTGSVSPSNQSGTILFPGTINFYGHHGILDTTFSNIEIQFKGSVGQLIVDTQSNDVEGNPHDYGRVALADLNFTQLDVSDSSVSGSATTSLTAAGADAFGQFYPVGDALDPISFSASLGGAPNCASGQGQAGAAFDSSGNHNTADQAAALRSSGGSGGGASGASGSTAGGGNRASGGTPGAAGTSSGSGLSVDDKIDVTESTTPFGDRANQFRVLGGGDPEENGAAGGGNRDEMLAGILLTLASLGVSGASLIRFTRKFA